MKYKVLFCGTPVFAVPSLVALNASPKFDVAKVLTQPDRPSGRGKKLKPSPVKMTATDFNISVGTPEKASSPEIIEMLKREKFDVGVVVAYGQLLSQDFLDSFKFGCVNLHSSLLPRWRGAAPMQRAIMEGDEETGVSLQKVVKKLDAGDVIGEHRIKLPIDRGATELYMELSQKGAELLMESLLPFLEGSLTLKPQDESRVTYAKKILKEEGLIEWSEPAFAIHNKIRGLDMGGPFAFTHFNEKTLKIHKSIFTSQESSAQPGMVVDVKKDSFVVACGKGELELLTVQPESKAKMSAADFIRGYHLKEGDRFE